MRYLVLLCLVVVAPLRAQEEPVAFSKLKVAGVSANLVTVDLNSWEIEVEPVMPSGGGAVNFETLARRSGAIAAINGTFFDPPTSTVICTLVRDGKMVAEGRVGNTLAVDWDNRATFHATAGRPGRDFDWTRYDAVISAGPTLLQDGRVALAPWSEGFRDPGLLGTAPRAALGITGTNKLLMVTVSSPISLRRMAWVMQGLGALHALNLDGGSSTGLYYRGQVKHRPRRSMTNLLVVRPRRTLPASAREPVPGLVRDALTELAGETTRAVAAAPPVVKPEPRPTVPVGWMGVAAPR